MSWAKDDLSTSEDETWIITEEPWYKETVAKDESNLLPWEDLTKKFASELGR